MSDPGNGRSTEGKTNWTGNFLGRITPGNWIVLLGLTVTAVWNYAALTNQNLENSKTLTDISTAIQKLATVDYVNNQKQQTDADIARLAGTVSQIHNEISTLNQALGDRITVISDRSVANGNAIAALTATVEALKETVYRQASNRTRDFNSSPYPGGSPPSGTSR